MEFWQPPVAGVARIDPGQDAGPIEVVGRKKRPSFMPLRRPGRSRKEDASRAGWTEGILVEHRKRSRVEDILSVGSTALPATVFRAAFRAETDSADNVAWARCAGKKRRKALVSWAFRVGPADDRYAIDQGKS